MMHASIALCVMMVGGYLPPESEITTVPLNIDPAGFSNIQDLEWKEGAKNIHLPQVPTIQNGQSSVDDSRKGKFAVPYPPTDPRAPQGRSLAMPAPPTQAGPANGGGYQAGGIGQAGGYGQQGYSSGAPKNDPYANVSVARNPVTATGAYVQPTPQAIVAPSTSNFTNGYSANALTAQYGLPPIATPSVGGASSSKPFNGYQPPSGYSPWMALNASTNNGTLNPYTAYVQPAVSQQNFNSHVSEQINGVQTMQRNLNSGTPGTEVNVGGNGLANPQIFQNYRGYYPTY